MKQIPSKAWLSYIGKLRRLNTTVANCMQAYVDQYGVSDSQKLIDVAYGLVTKYGEGSAALASEMYDALAELQGAHMPAAEPAETAEYGEVARMVNATKTSTPQLKSGVSRLVKRAGADTMLINALRDGAEFAWVPSGDTCAFCMTLASRGWQRASKKAIKNGHAEHIHANCDCTYAIRFDPEVNVEGYDPDAYLKAYRDAGSDVNELRRIHYAENRERINAQKRAAYAARKLNDIEIGRSIGAKAKNYVVVDKSTGEEYYFIEGTRLQNAQVFAGKGGVKPLREEVAQGLAAEFGGKPEDWQHCKAQGWLDVNGEQIKAEVHWFQNGSEKVKFKVKEWLYDED